MPRNCARETSLRAGLSPLGPPVTAMPHEWHGNSQGRRLTPRNTPRENLRTAGPSPSELFMTRAARGTPRETAFRPNLSPSGPPVTPAPARCRERTQGRRFSPRGGPRETFPVPNPSPSGPPATLLGVFAFFAAVLQPSCALERVSQNPLHLRIRAPHVVLCPAFYRGPDLRVDSKGILLASCHWCVLPRG